MRSTNSLIFTSIATFLLAAATAMAQVPDRPLNIIVFGAHPDDPEEVGGTMAKFVAQGHHVRLVSMTNGNAGHFSMGGGPLAQRRFKETQCSGAVIGAEYVVLDNDDGKLMPTLENREEVIRQIRSFDADIVISPRPDDYHPDHRNTGLLVRDAAYMVTVPNIVPLTPHLLKNPVFIYTYDQFTEPTPFKPDIVVAIDDTIEKKLDMYACHVSQVYEWLPYNMGMLDQVPKNPGERRAWLGKLWGSRSAEPADEYRDLLIQLYGQQRGSKVKYAEGFEVSEYGRQPNLEELKRLFPFFD
jgi:LmbE family N-acetylglucosaminyl deacetylase